MYATPTFAVFALSGLFFLIGAVQLTGPRFVRAAYREWDYPQHLRIITGMLDIAAAVMLTNAELRGWGIGLAGIISFGAGVTLLNHRRWFCAALTALMMVALVPASLAFPRESSVQFMAVAR